MADGSVKIEVLLDDSKVSGGVKKVEGRLSGIAGTAKRGLATVGKLAGALGLVGLAYKGIDMVKNSLDGAIDRYDTLNNFPRVMAQIGFDADTSQKAIDKLSDGIQGLPTRLDEVASTAQNIAIMTGDLDLAVDTTLALNNAFLASGASAQDAQRGLDQYVQMLAKGEVDLQSWRTLQETMPYALRKTAEAFGFTGESATNDFYEALKSGEITMSEFNDKLIELDQAQGGFAETAQTASGGIKTAWTNMKTWIVMGVADVIAAIDDALGGVGSIEGAINSLKPIVQGVFGWIANTAIPAVANGVQWVREKFDELKPVLDKVKDALEPLFEVFKQTGENLSNQLSPILEKLMQVFSSLWPIIEKIAVIVGGALVASIIIATTVLNGLLNAIGPLIEAFLSLVDVVVNVVNTIIALLTGDFDAALEYWDEAVESSIEFFKNLWEGIVGFFEGIVDTIIGWLSVLTGTSKEEILEMKDKVIEYFVNLKDESINKAKEFVQGIKDRFDEMKQEAINKVVEAKNNVVNRFNELKTQAINKVTEAKNSVINRFNELKTQAVDKVNEFKNNIRDKFDEIKQEMVNKAKQAVTDTISEIGELPGKIRAKATEFFSAGENIVTSIADGIKSAFSKVTGAMSDLTSKIRDFLPFSPAKEGPLRDIMNVKIAESIAEAIRKGRNSAVKEMDKLASDLFETAQPKHDLLANIRGYTPNAVLSGYIPNTVQVKQQLIESTKYKQQQPVIKIHAGDVIMDGRKVGEIVWRPVKENIDRDAKIIESFRG